MDKKFTVLLVEDEGPAVLAIQEWLTKAGYLVSTAFSAQEGLKAALENHPDAIILDIVMPIESGLNMLPELRADSWGQDAKVVVFSNLSDSEQKAKADKYKVEKYLVKADTPLKDLEEVIKDLLPENNG